MPTLSPANINTSSVYQGPVPIKHHRPAAGMQSTMSLNYTGGDGGRLSTRHRDSIACMSLPQISEDSSSFSSSPGSISTLNSTCSSNLLRCESPASISSLSSLSSGAYSSSLSSMDDLDEPPAPGVRRAGRYHTGSPIHTTSGSSHTAGTSRRKRRVCFHPNVLLWTSVQQGDFAELRQILSKSPTSTLDGRVHDRLAVNVANHQGITPLHLCCFAGADECARLLLLHGARADCSDDDGWTPLHAAAVGGHNHIVSYVVRAGGDIHRPDAFGRTPIDVATNPTTKSLLQRLSAQQAARPVFLQTTSSMICTEV
eukprot:scpid67390/ scgid21884/ Protein phosphatase 1 regulatory inhibitor subunit 16B; Ankyrin repeat domain-containing protein 4; CAAX box protein TIMAP; TGF-beta-inhibited membrane-associated protein